MMTLRRCPAESGGKSQRGTALVLSLVAVIVVAGMCMGFVKLASATSRAQSHAVDQMRSFYLAEAGLAEAFLAVRMGRTGAIGTEEAPAVYGDGTIWVASVQTPDSRVWLRSMAQVGVGSATLGYIIDPPEAPLGFFADEDLVIESAILVDGFDSTERSYEAEVLSLQAAEPEPDPTPSGPYVVVNSGSPHAAAQEKANELSAKLGFERLNSVLVNQVTLRESPVGSGSYSWTLYHAPWWPGDYLSPEDYAGFTSSLTSLKLASDAGALVPTEAGLGWNPWATGGDGSVGLVLDPLLDPLYGRSLLLGDEPALAADDSDPEPDLAVAGAAGDSPGVVPELTHTERGGVIGSNGDITFAEGAAGDAGIFGSLVPGTDGQVTGIDPAQVSGSTAPRALDVTLDPVQIPTVTDSIVVDHSSLVPYVVPAGTTGITTLNANAGSEVVIRGPAKILVHDLTLAEGATLTVDTRDGDVDLIITGSIAMDPTSFVETTGLTSKELRIEAGPADENAAAPRLDLDAMSSFHGTIYAPESEVRIGTNFELFGSVVARRLELGAGVRLHFDDESYNGNLEVPTQDAWQILDLPDSAAGRSIAAHAAGSAAAAAAADAATPPGVRVALAQAHDLGAVQLSLRYLDSSGVEQQYVGAEAAMDWSAVESVEAVERAPAFEAASVNDLGGDEGHGWDSARLREIVGAVVDYFSNRWG